ncbi:hypothetical protein FE257_010975 [Aspergillus nanangensis]|uniref:AB hydrolase-1 domain-containing protein n=1 Tax=Aspergillus nanangensis TaxID=2582783 RepID=A0AAD4CID8_ASPNN|nr:hypothetical protein FE257_010975 [Aspergillus nanangensis]
MDGQLRNLASHSLSSLSLPLRGTSSQDTNKRRLLLIYIHGFMGSGASFHDFPAHVHNLLTDLLSDSHVVYTRIYPRYKSHGEIQTAVIQFSDWLSPHEAEDLDVVLLGHSLGGILAADVALLQQPNEQQPKHRILGLVNFDVPFLGLHPRVIPTGISGSIPKKEESLGLEPVLKPVAPNPNFDPPFMNDIRRVERGFFKGIMHFVNKNQENLPRSVFDRLVSSFKFAGCVGNYSELRARYRRLVKLETAEYSPGRVRFVNYYTASTGRKKKTKTEHDDAIEDTTTTTTPSQESSEKDLSTSSHHLAAAVDDDDSLLKATPSHSSLTSETKEDDDRPSVDLTSVASSSSSPNNPRDYNNQQHLAESVSNISLSTADSSSGPSADPTERKLRKFILLPSHHWKRDNNSYWTPILMEDMDEVAAHQCMFVPQGANYDHLVGDSVALIEQWVQSDLSRRLLQESLD